MKISEKKLRSEVRKIIAEEQDIHEIFGGKKINIF